MGCTFVNQRRLNHITADGQGERAQPARRAWNRAKDYRTSIEALQEIIARAGASPT